MKEFNTGLKEEQIKIDDCIWAVREMTTVGRESYNKALSNTMEVIMDGTGKYDKKGNEIFKKKIKVLDLGGAQLALLKATMEHQPEEGKIIIPVEAAYPTWGSKLAEELVKIASDLNGMEVPEEVLDDEAEKN